jgi:4-aminobutyrate aminotransferase
MDTLREATCHLIGEVRGRGLMIGIELVVDRGTRVPLSPEAVGDITVESLRRGVIMVPCGRAGNVLRIMPSLTIPRSYLFAALEILLDILNRHWLNSARH